MLLVNEEYGYRYWIAKCNKEKAQELKQWWLKLPTVMGMFFNPCNGFPIQLTELTEENYRKYDLDNTIVYIKLHEDSDSSLKVIGDQTCYHAGYKNHSN